MNENLQSAIDTIMKTYLFELDTPTTLQEIKLDLSELARNTGITVHMERDGHDFKFTTDGDFQYTYTYRF